MNAVISPCGKYRYVLRRSLGSVLRWHRPILFIMLNPSIADATVDDPTIRRCMSFAKREGMTQLTVVNLFALRSTDPKQLMKAIDPFGPENFRYICEEVKKSEIVVAAWGALPFARFQGRCITQLYGPFRCLGKTKAGAPRHPLYIKSDQPLEDYYEI